MVIAGSSFRMLCWGSGIYTALWWIPRSISWENESQVLEWWWIIPWRVRINMASPLSVWWRFFHHDWQMLIGFALFSCVNSTDVSGSRTLRNFYEGVVDMQVPFQSFINLQVAKYFHCYVYAWTLRPLIFWKLPRLNAVFQGVEENLPRICTRQLDPTSVIFTSTLHTPSFDWPKNAVWWACSETDFPLPSDCYAFFQCFFPQNLITSIKTPLFILNAAYDSWQVTVLIEKMHIFDEKLHFGAFSFLAQVCSF